jgi:hypothetical protein
LLSSAAVASPMADVRRSFLVRHGLHANLPLPQDWTNGLNDGLEYDLTRDPSASARVHLRLAAVVGLMWAGLFLGLAVVVGALVGDLARSVQIFFAAEPFLLASGALALALSAALTSGWRWRTLLPSTSRPAGSVMIGAGALSTLIGMVLPPIAVDAVCAELLGRRARISVEAAMAASLYGRLITTVVAAAMTLVVLPYSGVGEELTARLLVGAVGLAAAGGVLLPVLLYSPTVAARVFARPLALIAHTAFAGVASRVDALLQRFAAATRSGVRVQPFAFAVLITTAGALVGAVGLSAIMVATGAEFQVQQAVLAYSGPAALGLALIFLPFGQVGTDAGFTSLLIAVCHLSPPHALLICSFVRLVQTGALFVTALLALRTHASPVVE